jgi:hypothetical protein
VKLLYCKAPRLEGLAEEVLPITLILKTYTIMTMPKTQKMATQYQLPIITMYTLMDYWGQGQMLILMIIEIGRPPMGKLTAFNVYITLS